MGVLVCADAFKEAAGAPEVCEAIKRGILACSPTIKVDLCPLADGGEGTARILSQQLGFHWIQHRVNDPLGRPVIAGFGWDPSSRTAVLDTAEASGLQYLDPEERNPLLTSTFGTGQLLLAALEKGACKIYLGLGGSATTEAGIGMGAALGIRFFREEKPILYPIGKDMPEITRIDFSARHPLLAKADIHVLADVRNPLFGPKGAAHVYGPQKGATPQQIEQLDQGLRQIHSCWSDQGWSAIATQPGAGAAGGLGAGSMVFLNARLVAGAPTIFGLLEVEKRFREADLVITGEGKLDHQSLQGKLIEHLGQLARSTQVPLIALCGQCELNPSTLKNAGLTAAYAIQPGPMTVRHSMQQTLSFLERQATMVMATFNAGKR